MAEARDAGFCARGQRKWLEARLPGWRQYLRTGMPVEVAMTVHPQLVARVRKLREQRNG
jgi:hypothetical protein